MNLFFDKTIILKSKYDSNELFAILERNSNPEMNRFKNDKIFKGFVYKDNTIWLIRNIIWRIPFQPIIKGRILKTGQTSQLKLRFIMNIADWVVLGLMGLILFGLAYFNLRNGSNGIVVFVILFLLLFGYTLPLLAFNYDMKKSLNEFNKLIN